MDEEEATRRRLCNESLKLWPMSAGNCLALGTAQFGFPYGIASQGNPVSRQRAAEILKIAVSAGSDTLDTAMTYGDSEQVLGEIGIAGWRVITKLPVVPDDCRNVERWIHDAVQGALQRLCVSRLTGLLLHRPLQLLECRGSRIYQALLDLKRQGLVEKIGFSIYGPVELDQLCEAYPPDLVQVPLNILDRRMQTSGWLASLHQAGIEVHVRSIFLQGLLLMDHAVRPVKFQPWASLWRAWDQWLEQQQLTPLQACLGFALAHPEIDRIVVGVDSPEQFSQILTALPSEPRMPPENLMIVDESLINPSRWNTL